MLFFDGKWVHFIGAGGVGVNALALFILDMGGRVSGSDVALNERMSNLSAKGASVWQGEIVENMRDADIVVFSSAIKDDNKELTYAKENGIKVFERGEFLGKIATCFGKVVGIAGTHGKSTTTSMLTHVLNKADKNFVSFIGGESVEFANYVNNNCDKRSIADCIFVGEACEYHQSLLHIKGDISLVTNTDLDHPDCYKSEDDIKRVYDKFLSSSKTPLTTDDCCKMLDVKRDGKDLFIKGHKLSLLDDSAYNRQDALCAIAIATLLGVDTVKAVEYMASYLGIKRRFERAKDIDGVPCYFDFAHHPSEIESLLSRDFDSVMLIFQPHTYSRTKAYFDDFVRVLSTDKIKTVVITKTYAAREQESDGYTSDRLFDAIFDKYSKRTVYLAQNAQKTLEFVKIHAKSHDIILFVGAGDIYDLKKQL